mgnify:CR=1 FL=1
MIHALNMVWNPSEGIDLGFFMLRYYSLMFVVAFGLGWYIMKHIFEREGLDIEKLDSVFVYTVNADPDLFFGAALHQSLCQYHRIVKTIRVPGRVDFNYRRFCN